MKHILFVDDEQDVLDGLRNALRPDRARWRMSFALGGEQALRVLAERHHDVLVTDMRMPGMDGLALLTAVRERFPGVARIVLSGHAELSSVVNAIAVAHRYVPKPCEPSVLRAVLADTIELMDLFANQGLRELVGGLGTLPSAPAIYRELTSAIGNPDVGFEAIAAILERDMGLAARALQLVNSAYCGLTRRVTSVQEAVRRLGINTLRHLALTVEVFRSFGATGAAKRAMEQLESHAQLTAAIARALAANPREADTAFAAGLLHDVGKLVLASRAKDVYARLLDAHRAGQPLVSAEVEALGANHAQIGAYLLGLWDLPHDVLQPVAFHHVARPGRSEPAALIAAADALAYEAAGLGSPEREPLDRLVPPDELKAWRAVAAEAAKRVAAGGAP